MPSPASVELLQVSKRFGKTVAVHDVTLTIAEGEFFCLLGSSGCGKTTTLRLIGGLETPDSGEIRIAGDVVNDQPPYERRANIVFQNYALFPHLTVQDNIAFGLRVRSRRVPEALITQRVEEALALVHLQGLGTRRPQQLSGGQQQRVALARALVLRPQVLLLDEPLGALDRQLRKAMQAELRRIQREVGMTFLYVTHDQEEALSLADRLAVMRHGRLEHVGTPQQVFQRPRTTFVAEFLGAANIITGRVTTVAAGMVEVSTPTGLHVCSPQVPGIQPGSGVSVVIRPDAVQVMPAHAGWAGENTALGRITATVYQGEVTEITVTLTEGEVLISRMASRLVQQQGYREQECVRVGWYARDSHLIPAE
jgi:spermidine/putrescine transport system ATP-binding protein